MLPYIIHGMIYCGAALMVYNIYGFIRFARFVRELKSWKGSSLVLYVPIVLLVFFLFGYLFVGFLGDPDLIMAGILFGGSIFVFIIYKLLISIVRRIVEAEQMETRYLATKESDRVKSSFLANMSHEMRTPINVIHGLTIISLRDSSLSAKTRRNLEKIELSSRHFAGLVNMILDMNRIENGQIAVNNREFSLEDSLKQVNAIANTLCEGKGLEYHCIVPDNAAGLFRGDAPKLREVLLSIIENSVKYTHAPGNVRLLVEIGPEENAGNHPGEESGPGRKDSGNPDSENKGEIFDIHKVRLCRFTVTDTGIGIDADFLPHVFEAFSREDASSTTRYGGSGLGLALTKGTVELMGGTITAESEKGVGSSFTVTVPLGCVSVAEAAVTGDPSIKAELSESAASSSDTTGFPAGVCQKIIPADHPAAHEALSGEESPAALPQAENRGTDTLAAQEGDSFSLSGRRILIAEDIPENAEIVTDLLELEGVVTEHASNGQVAVDMAAKADAGYYDAILMDMRMPVMDGLEATRRIRALKRPDAKTIPIIALTANAFDSDVRAVLDAGMNTHLSKPIDPDLLYDTLKKAISNYLNAGRNETS